MEPLSRSHTGESADHLGRRLRDWGAKALIHKSGGQGASDQTRQRGERENQGGTLRLRYGDRTGADRRARRRCERLVDLDPGVALRYLFFALVSALSRFSLTLNFTILPIRA